MMFCTLILGIPGNLGIFGCLGLPGNISCVAYSLKANSAMKKGDITSAKKNAETAKWALIRGMIVPIAAGILLVSC